MMIFLLICFTGLLQLGNVSAKPTSERSADSISKEYKLQFYAQANWYNAYLFCRENGMQLASVNSRQEQDYLKELIEDTGLETHWWVSASDLGYENRFSWYPTGKLVKYTNWDVNQPDNTNGNENCLLLKSNYKWNDSPCAQVFPFICEIPY